MAAALLVLIALEPIIAAAGDADLDGIPTAPELGHARECAGSDASRSQGHERRQGHPGRFLRQSDFSVFGYDHTGQLRLRMGLEHTYTGRWAVLGPGVGPRPCGKDRLEQSNDRRR